MAKIYYRKVADRNGKEYCWKITVYKNGKIKRQRARASTCRGKRLLRFSPERIVTPSPRRTPSITKEESLRRVSLQKFPKEPVREKLARPERTPHRSTTLFGDDDTLRLELGLPSVHLQSRKSRTREKTPHGVSGRVRKRMRSGPSRGVSRKRPRVDSATTASASTRKRKRTGASRAPRKRPRNSP